MKIKIAKLKRLKLDLESQKRYATSIKPDNAFYEEVFEAGRRFNRAIDHIDFLIDDAETEIDLESAAFKGLEFNILEKDKK